MKILLIAATPFEIAPTSTFLKNERTHCAIETIVTGVGIANASFSIGKCNLRQYDLLIQAGIAGAIDKDLQIGQVVQVNEDFVADLGAEDGENFIPFSEMNLPGSNYFKSSCNWKSPLLEQLVNVRGATVNKVLGNEVSISDFKKRFNAQVETMEGASFMMAGEYSGRDFIQLRAISNYVEKRDTSKWNIPLAIEQLNQFLVRLLKELNEN